MKHYTSDLSHNASGMPGQTGTQGPIASRPWRDLDIARETLQRNFASLSFALTKTSKSVDDDYLETL
jgi:hypothetical protein